jgi:AcrR family transcriptional regulator
MQERLSQAAYEIIRDGGYVNFRTSAVSKLAGVSQGAQLHHFPTKNSLALAALDYAYEKAQLEFENNFALCDQYDDLLDLILKDFMDFYLSDYFNVALDIIMAGGKNEELRNKVIELSRTSRLKVERLWLEKMIDDGWSLKTAEDVLALSHSIVRGFAVRALVLNDRSEFERLLKQWRVMAEALKPRN